MVVLSHSKFMVLLLLIEAALLRGSHGQDVSSRSSRRETSDMEDTKFVGADNRAQAGEAICLKTFSRLFDDHIADREEEGGIWPESPPEFSRKPIISKSWGGTARLFFLGGCIQGLPSLSVYTMSCIINVALYLELLGIRFEFHNTMYHDSNFLMSSILSSVLLTFI